MVHLDYVAFHLTYVCGNKCPYCYVGNENRKSHPSFEVVQKVISKLISSNIKEILFVGGDPCTYPQLKVLVSQIKNASLKCSILSNTLDFGDDFSFFINNLDNIEVTVLGESKKSHDLETKKEGSFVKLVNNIKKINKAGKKVKIWISVSNSNYKKVFSIVENLVVNEKLDISAVGVQRIIPRGRACDSLKDSLSKDKVNVVFEQLGKINKAFSLPVVFEDPFPLCIVDKKYHFLQTHKCLWGFSIGSVRFDGALGRCGADNRFLLGNVLDISDLQKFWLENSVLNDFRGPTWLPKKCQSCEMLKDCWCGCSLSRVTTKDHEKDILCSFS